MIIIFQIFPSKINIPNLDNTSLVKKYINPLLPEFGTCVGFGDEILSLLENPRDFEAVINSYKLLLLNLSENCNKYTLFQLEILRHKRYELYEYIRKSGDSLEKFSAQTFTEEILKKNDKIIISLRVGNSYNTEKNSLIFLIFINTLII
ncbi:MAG: hypothetical protein IPN72_19465 [Saprospiraceae bacterium]|nr:hypothetical protein [Saprospiraceae bacterium]